MKTKTLTPRFVESIPDVIDDGVLYVSMGFSSAMHRCACGCGEEVVTPLSPTDWQLYFDGENVSLEPSIGNWGFRCRSHYWIRAGKIRWSNSMSESDIEDGRAQDASRKSLFYEEKLSNSRIVPVIVAGDSAESEIKLSRSFGLKRLIGWRRRK